MAPHSALALSPLLVAGRSLGAAEARLPSENWAVTVGGGAMAVPSCSGASSFRIMPAPLIDARYRDVLFLNAATGAGVNVLFGPRGRAGFAVKPDYGRSASWGDRLRGWGDIGAGADCSMFGALHLFPVTLQAEVHRQFGAGKSALAVGPPSPLRPLPTVP